MDFRKICTDKNISPSYTRMRVFDYLKQSKTHPTVDVIYKALKPDLPTLSKTTIYNVLDLFIKHKIILPVHFITGEYRYEILGESHSHFKCNICDRIYDIPLVETIKSEDNYQGFKVESEEVILNGICNKCSIK